MLLALGLFVFDLGTLPLEELARRTAWKHARNPRVGARDASQFLGPGDDTITLDGALLPGVAGTFAAMRTLRTIADQGEALPLVTGTGEVLGDFVVTGLSERKKHLTVDGVARRTDFSIELERVR